MTLSIRSLSIVFALAYTPAAFAQPQVSRSQTVPSGTAPFVASTADVKRFQLSADESRIVYLADADQDELVELYSLATTGGVPQKLNGPFPAGRRGVLDFQITPNGRRVLFVADQEALARRELFSCPIEGGPIVRIERDLFEQNYAVSSDSKRVVFLRKHPQRVELWVASIETGAGVRISPRASSFQVTADAQRVLFIKDRSDGLFPSPLMDLFSARLEEPEDVLQLAQLVSSNFVLSPDSSYVVYTADPPGPNTRHQLYSVAVDRSTAPVTLSGRLSPRQWLGYWTVSPDGNHVVYGQVYDLYSAAIDGRSAPVRLNPEPIDSRSSWLLTPGRVSFVLDGPFSTLYSTPITVGAATLIDDEVRVLLRSSPDGTRALYTHFDAAGLNGLLIAPLDGLEAPTRIADLPPYTTVLVGEEVQFALEGGLDRVVYQVRGLNHPWSLFSAQLDGSLPPVDLSDLHAAGEVQQFALVHGLDSVVFAGDAGEPGVVELFRVPIDGSGSPQILVDF